MVNILGDIGQGLQGFFGRGSSDNGVEFEHPLVVIETNGKHTWKA
jgi:hypothetical protein